MDRLTNLAILRETAAEVLAIDPDLVVEDASFAEDLEADSLDLAEIAMILQERLDTSLPSQDLKEVTTVGQALDWILRNQQATAREQP